MVGGLMTGQYNNILSLGVSPLKNSSTIKVSDSWGFNERFQERELTDFKNHAKTQIYFLKMLRFIIFIFDFLEATSSNFRDPRNFIYIFM